MSNRSTDSFWTDAKKDELLKLWPTNYSQREIAAKLGCTIGALSGKAMRLKLPKKPNPRYHIAPPRPHSVVDDPHICDLVRKMSEARVPTREIAAAVAIARTSVMEIRRNLDLQGMRAARTAPKPRTPAPPRTAAPTPPPTPPTASTRPHRPCLWLDGPRGQMRECGAPQIAGTSYCAEHAKRAFMPGGGGLKPALDRSA